MSLQCHSTFSKPAMTLVVCKIKHLSSLQWTDWLYCGELLHSELVATADLLRRVHAHWNVQATQPYHAWRVGGYTVTADNMQDNKLPARSCSGREGLVWVVESGDSEAGERARPPDWGSLPRVFAANPWSKEEPGVVTKNPLCLEAAGTTSSGIP